MSMGFASQEYWSGFLFPSPGDLPYPGIEPGSPALLENLLQLSHQGNHVLILYWMVKNRGIFEITFEQRSEGDKR